MAGRYRGNHLALHEEIVLLALEDRKGTFQWSMPAPVLGGAIFADLLVNERVEIPDTDEKDPLIDVVDDEPLGNPVLDEALERMATAKRRARLTHWVSRFGNKRGVPHEIARELCRRGILREDEQSVLFFFRRRIFPEVNPVPERRLKARLEKAIFGEGTVDEKTAVLIALANTADVLKHAFESQRLKRRKKRIERITEEQPVGKAAKQLVETAVVALLTTVTTTSIVTSS